MSDLATLRGVIRYADQHPQAMTALRRLLTGPLAPADLSPEIDAALSLLARVADHGGPLRFDGGAYLLTRAGREAVEVYDLVATQRERSLARLSVTSGDTTPTETRPASREVKDGPTERRGAAPPRARHRPDQPTTAAPTTPAQGGQP